MNEDIIFKIVELIIVIIAAIVARYVVPYMKLSIGESKMEKLLYWITTFVRSAEMLFGEKTGEEKLKYVLTNVTSKLNDIGIKVDETDLRALIEDAVYSYTQNTKEK